MGYDREGLQLVVALSRGDLGAAIELVHQTFLKTSLVTQPNVVKAARELIAERDAKSASAAAAGQAAYAEKGALAAPRQVLDASQVAHAPTVLTETDALGTNLRCTICTLPLPCKHVSGSGLVAVAKKRLGAMRQDPTMPLCPSYARTGCCEAMNTLGYCRNHHPPHAYAYAPAVRRCPTCTTPEPCGLCPWFLHRRCVARAVAAAAEELADLKHQGTRSTVTLARCTRLAPILPSSSGLCALLRTFFFLIRPPLARVFFLFATLASGTGRCSSARWASAKPTSTRAPNGSTAATGARWRARQRTATW